MIKLLLIIATVLLLNQAQIHRQNYNRPHNNNNDAQCGPRIRRSWYSLTENEKQRYVDAVDELKQNGEFDIFNTMHNEETNRVYAHGHPGFCPWHRWFLYQFENAIRDLKGYECFTLPYWPFEREAGSEMLSDVFNYLGGPSEVNKANLCVTKKPFSTWTTIDNSCLRRTFNSTYSYIGEARLIDIISSNPVYGTTTGFRSSLEGAPHASVHNFIGGGGGHMGTMLSNADPLFYLLHCNVDRIFSIWSDCHEYDKEIDDDAWPSFDTSPRIAMPYLANGETYLRRFSQKVGPLQMYNYNSKSMPYFYDKNDRLVALMAATAGNASHCKFDWFNTKPRKRSVEEEAQVLIPPSVYQDVHFTDPRVQTSYDHICTKEIPEAPKLFQIHATAIAECNICTGGGKRKHASDEWIRQVGMWDQRIVFQPICVPQLD